MAKYDALRWHLESRGSALEMSFNEIADLVGGLPPSANEYREWWANDESHVQAQAWLHAHRVVERVDLVNRIVLFSVPAPQKTSPGS